MRLYQVLLFVHTLGLIGLFVGLGIHVRAGMRLRAAATLREAGTWLDWLAMTAGMLHGGLSLLLVSGVVMTALEWREPLPWISTALLALLVIWALVIVSGRRLGAARRAAQAAGRSEAPVGADLARGFADAGIWGSMMAANLLALAVVWLMTTKPGRIESLGVTVVMGIAGAAIGTRLARPGSAAGSGANAAAEPAHAR